MCRRFDSAPRHHFINNTQAAKLVVIFSRDRLNMTSSIDKVRSAITESIALKTAIESDASLLNAIAETAELSAKTIKSGGKLIFAGNGGSFADSIHLAAELVGRFMSDRNPLPAIALGANGSTLTSISNDYGYDTAFARELEAIGRPADVFIGLSTSGNSKNIIACLKAAKRIGITSVVLTGKSGGEIAKSGLCRLVCVPADSTPRIQENHILFGHIICSIIEDTLAV